MSSSQTCPEAMLLLPSPRGPVGERVHDHLHDRRALTAQDLRDLGALVAAVVDPLGDEDVQLTLAVLHELHHQGFDDVPDDIEWDPALVDVRRTLERTVEDALRRETAPALEALRDTAEPDETVGHELERLLDADDGPALARWAGRHATLAQYRTLVARRSVLHLKEADPQTWVVPRLSGRAKSALLEIQLDEYGRGRPGRMHSELFARLMSALGLDPSYGAHWPYADASAFAVVNAMTMFGLNRRLRGMSVGQLTMTEMTSSGPNAALAAGLRRLGLGDEATWFYDEHVEADAVHEQVAMVDLAGSLVAAEPTLRRDVLAGAAAYLTLEKRFATALLDHWAAELGADAAA